MKKKSIATLIYIIAIIIVTCVVYQYLPPKYQFEIQTPTHNTDPGCSWVKKSFVNGISFFQEYCPQSNLQFGISFNEDKEGNIISTYFDGRQTKAMQIYPKDATQNPFNTVQNIWWNKLTPEQKKDCSIQDADEPYAKYNIETPHPTAHKTRYMIAIKPEVSLAIINASGDGLPSGSEYDFLCGSTVGSPFIYKPPYFEFDDRDPSKYLFIQSWGNDGGPPIDLNSIRF